MSPEPIAPLPVGPSAPWRAAPSSVKKDARLTVRLRSGRGQRAATLASAHPVRRGGRKAITHR